MKIASTFALLVALALVVLALAMPTALHAADLVAKTDPLTPAEQQKRFHVPEGFEIQLVASEPQINKPMNINFDARGRLWVSHSVEYPYAAKGVHGQGATHRDRISVIEGIDAGGKPSRVSDFATGMNIPIGVTPIGDGSQAIAWSIPNIWLLRDTNGDDAADERTPLLTGFGYSDTHGNQNGFTRWLDGWVYANHGFRNRSRVKLPQSGKGGKKASDAVVLDMQSGNTYRFMPDGSAAEHLTRGQVNPFGLAFDQWGYRYAADCHSMPIYQLINGAHYPSFGKGDDGLGFGPKMIDHNHGSTGIGGVAIYLDDRYPPGYRGNVFLGNVVTGKVHRDKLTWRGSSPTANKLDDFVTCDDPWFHPVDIKLGPDGALYICDFYNAIIGHYEVQLDHPKRDRLRGRIWRVVYRGKAKNEETGKTGEASPRTTDLTRLAPEALIDAMGHPNLTLRTLATHRLVDHHAEAGAKLALKAMQSERQADDQSGASPGFAIDREAQRVHAAWALHRVDKLDDALLRRLGGDDSPLVRTHAARILGATGNWSATTRELAMALLKDKSPHVQRAAAEAMRSHPATEQVDALLACWDQCPQEDTHLIHTLRVALRDHLKQDAMATAVAKRPHASNARKRLVGIAVAVRTGPATRFIYDTARKHADDVPPSALQAALPEMARRLPASELPRLIALVRARFAGDLGFQLTTFGQIERGLGSNKTAEAMREWAGALLDDAVVKKEEGAPWVAFTLDGKPTSETTWQRQRRDTTDRKGVMLMSSHPSGEQRTGILRSPVFELPAKLSFVLCGHNGYPGKPDHGKNRLRLRLANGGDTIAEQTPPRHDVARRYTWALPKHAGKRVYLEAIDGDTAGAYAWLAFGMIEPTVVRLPADDPVARAAHGVEAIEIAGRWTPRGAAEVVRAALLEADAAPAVRLAAANVMLRLDPAADAVPRKPDQASDAPLWSVFADASTPASLRETLGELLARSKRNDTRAAMTDMLAKVPQAVQRAIAMGLSQHEPGAEALLKSIESGAASPRLLLHEPLLRRLRSAKPQRLEARIKSLTQGLPAVDEQLRQLIENRRSAAAHKPGAAAKGKAVFLKHCAACHQIGKEGQQVGPNLDGIGVRGVDRLLEDVIDPNRNVDRAFRASEIETDLDGIVLGLVQREEDNTLVLVDATGKQRRIATQDITRRRELRQSLMPANLGSLIDEQGMLDLMAFLLEQREKTAKP